MIRVLPDVRRALDADRPVVALESSVFAQGLPAPQNAEAARRMVAAVEQSRSVPAITAVVGGTPTLGLHASELQRFLAGKDIRKVSARDLGAAIAQGADGATTVAAGMVIASQAGARVFVTGGIGGVHRAVPDDSSRVIDESADLLELARTPMVVVCAGAKAILDLPATWERLDTLGIPVVGVGTDEFPGFYTAHTGIPLTTKAKSPIDAAMIAAAHFKMSRPQAVLVVVPPPAAEALDADDVERAVSAAMASAAQVGVRGAAVTPYLLAAVSRETGGRSMLTNLALLESNARMAAEIAVALVAAMRADADVDQAGLAQSRKSR